MGLAGETSFLAKLHGWLESRSASSLGQPSTRTLKFSPCYGLTPSYEAQRHFPRRPLQI